MSEEEIVKALTNAMPHDILVNTNWTLYKDTKAKEIEIERLKNELELQNIEMGREIERLTELCNKYEEEHKTTFETWQKDIKENKQLHSIIKEIKSQLDYLETYSSKEDVFEDMKRRLDRIESIVNRKDSNE